MNKKTIILALVVIAALVIGIFIGMNSCTTQEETSTETEATVEREGYIQLGESALFLQLPFEISQVDKTVDGKTQAVAMVANNAAIEHGTTATADAMNSLGAMTFSYTETIDEKEVTVVTYFIDDGSDKFLKVTYQSDNAETLAVYRSMVKTIVK